MDISDKVAIVSGAAAGIGRATAIALAKAGAKGIALADVDDDGLAGTAKLVEEAGADVLALHIDVTDVDDLRRMTEETTAKWGGLDIGFNNAGIVSGPPPYPDSSLEKIAQVITIDLIAVIQAATLQIQYMRDNGGGVIVNTASTGALNPLPSDAQYAASKAGVLHFGASCATFAEEFGVRVNTICPGVTETAILEKTGGGVRPDWLGPILESIKVLSPEDIAEEVLKIIGDDNMAGQHVVVENEQLAEAS